MVLWGIVHGCVMGMVGHGIFHGYCSWVCCVRVCVYCVCTGCVMGIVHGYVVCVCVCVYCVCNGCVMGM